MKNKLVSIIIPTYARPTNLIQTVNSCLSQDYPNIEIIVVDDNGIGTQFQIETEIKLKTLILENKIIYIKHDTNKNGSAARNTGIKYSKGEYLNFVDDDDVLSRNKIRQQVNILDKKLDFDATYTDSIIISSKHRKKIKTPNEVSSIENILTGEIFFNTSTVLFRRSSIIGLNGFIESFVRHQDYELYLRFFRNHKMIRTPLCHVIKHEKTNIISSDPIKRESYLKYFINYFQTEIESSHLYNKIISYQYYICCISYIQNNMYNRAWRCLKISIKHNKLSIYQILKIAYHILF